MLLPVHIALMELKRYLVNRGELAFSLALPVVLFALMYGAFGRGDAAFHATAEVVDLDGGAHARALVERLDALDEITVRERSLADADDALERSAILSAAVIPAGFTAGLDAGEPVSITFRQRGSGGEDGQIVAGIVRAVALEVAGEARALRMVPDALEGTGIPRSRIDAVVSARLEDARERPGVGVVVREVGERGETGADPVARLAPGLLVMFLMFALTLGAQTLVEERQNATLERLMTTRLGMNQLFVGKFLAGVLRATIQALILLSLAFAALRIGDALDFAQLMAFSVLVAAAVSALGLVIGSVARTRDQAAWSAVVVTMFMTTFGGTFFDVAGSGALDTLSRVTLTRYAIDAMFGMLAGGETLAQQGPGAAILAGSAVVCLVAARAMFKISGGGR